MKRQKKKDPFIDSERNVFAGLKLEPWTESRRVAAQTLGMVYPNLNKAEWASMQRGGSYPGAVRDVMLALWLCTLPPGEVVKAEAAGIENAMEKSLEFGVKLGIHDQLQHPFWDALAKCMDMWHAVNDARTIPDPARTRTDDDDEGKE